MADRVLHVKNGIVVKTEVNPSPTPVEGSSGNEKRIHKIQDKVSAGSLTRFLDNGNRASGVGFLRVFLRRHRYAPHHRHYYDRLRLFDLDVKSTLGLTDEDIEAISALPESCRHDAPYIRPIS